MMKTQDCIFYQLSRVSRAGARFWHKKVARFGLTSSQALVLMFLLEEDQISAGVLSDKTQFDSATLTGLIDRMEKSGVVQRKNHPEDRRAILICLTEKGTRIAQNILEMIQPANDEFLSRLTPEEALILRALLKKIE